MSFLATLFERKPGQALVRERLVMPVQAFMHTETAGGIVIVVAAIAALIWANSPWDEAYFDLWHAELGFDVNLFHVEHHLGDWVNDGLMVIFFFVVGLEIKRELVHGELASPRRAALPVIAALGGMAVPALIFLAFNAGGEGKDGWAIPVATDIAFAVGVLALLGPRVPFSLKVFLLALAIADDLGGILIIAAFYTDQISVEALLWAGTVLLLVLFARSWGIRTFNVYVFLGVLFWVAVLQSGIHATISGVILAMLTPAGPSYTGEEFERSAPGLFERWREAIRQRDHDQQENILSALEDVTRNTESPLDRLERQLHPWVSYIIVPIFALANAGVAVTADSVNDAVGSAVTWGIALGLFVGKPVGILTATWLAERSGIASRPAGVTWHQVLGVGLLGGVGFTVALFITTLSFDSEVLTADAKMGILLGSITAAIVGYTYLRLLAGKAESEPAGGEGG
jgi:NhaA family Na+:H+ antiporter